MKHWDDLGDLDVSAAQVQYMNLLDREIPNAWDVRIPSLALNNEWEIDETVDECRECRVVFTLFIRRHHCRRCFRIYCDKCTASREWIVLTRGAKAKYLRICLACVLVLKREREDKYVEELMEANRRLERQIESIQLQSKAEMIKRSKKIRALKKELSVIGLDMSSIEEKIQQKEFALTLSAPLIVPKRSEQDDGDLMKTHRELGEFLQVAESRAKDVLEKTNASLDLLEEETRRSQPSIWVIFTTHCLVYCDLVDLVRLRGVCKPISIYLVQHDTIRRYIETRGVSPSLRPYYWQFCTLSNNHDAFQAIRSLSRKLSMDQQLPMLKTASLYYSSSSRAAHQWHHLYDVVLETCVEQDDRAILNDVKRTFGSKSIRRLNTIQTTDPYRDIDLEVRRRCLLNVLQVFAALHPDIGYCQGQNHIVAMILSQLHWEEHRAFWLFTSLCHANTQYRLADLFRLNAQLRFYQLDRLIQLFLPQLHQHLARHQIEPNVYASGWIMTLYTNFDTLSLETVAHVFDLFLIDGWSIIFRVALTILTPLKVSNDWDFEQLVHAIYQLKQTKVPISIQSYPQVTQSMLDQFEREMLDPTSSDAKIVPMENKVTTNQPPLECLPS